MKIIPNLDSSKRILMFPEDEVYVFAFPAFVGFFMQYTWQGLIVAVFLWRLLCSWKLKTNNNFRLVIYWFSPFCFKTTPPAWIKIFRG